MGEIALRADKFAAAARAMPLLELAQHRPDLSKAALVPLADLPAVIGDLERALAPPTSDEAVKIVQRLLGSYARHGIEDPETWSSSIASIFAEYPASLAWAAVDKLTRRLKFVPVRADVVEELDALRRPLLYARAMALAMEREQQRRAEEDEAERAKAAIDPEARRKQVAELFAKMGINT